MNDQYDSSYTSYQVNRGRIRKRVRQLYLEKAASWTRGATLDFGCGVGELLRRLPSGSMGLEYNQATVSHCHHEGLPVIWYDGFADDWALTALEPGRRFESMVISHVLEHLEEPLEVLLKLLRSGRARGIRRVLVIVPGRAGFRIDHTHRTFVDLGLLSTERIPTETGFRSIHAAYFPLNLRMVGDWFPHHELQMVFEHP